MARPKNLDKMSLEALVGLRESIAAAISQRAAELKGQLSRLSDVNRNVTRGHLRDAATTDGQRRVAQDGRGSALKGRKVEPKYRSKKDPTLTWAGRGATPRWLREEMKAGKLNKEAFLIERA
jgi:DNA-binding protein H-NS